MIEKAAQTLVENGFSVLPCGPDKKATIKWTEFQTRRMTSAEVKRYFTRADRMAVIGGQVSGNLECIDFDDPETYAPFLELLTGQDAALAASLAKRRTPSGGYHLIYRCTAPVGGNLKLACDPAGAVRIETRGEGGYFLTAPSPGYEIIEHGLLATPTISAEQRALVHALARLFDQRPQRGVQAPPADKDHAGSPGSDFNARHTVADTLTRYGWHEDRRTTAGIGWTRPGKDSGTSGVLLDGSGNFFVWSSNAAPLESGHSYGAFAIYAAYEHGGDFTAAAKALAQAGYGAPQGPRLSSAKGLPSHPQEQQASPNLDAPVLTVAEAIKKARRGDPAAVFEESVIQALRLIKQQSTVEFQRLRLDIKKAAKGVRISELDDAIRGEDEVGHERGLSAMLVDMARERCQLFKTEDREAYATFVNNGHRECWRIGSEGFSEWLSFSCYRETGTVPNDKGMAAALGTLAGIAKFEGEERHVNVRVACHEGAVWLDLTNDAWQAIEITAGGWRIVDTPPVMFTRARDMRPLPTPEPGGDLAELWSIVNVPEDERLIVLAWLLECLRSETPYAVLELTGEQGSAKSTTQHYLRELIDPNRANLRAAPKAVEDVFISAKNAHIVSFENLSYMKPEYQDALCIMATGGGYAARKLYTNSEETVFNVKKPVMLNGIAVVVTAQDLLDRTVHISLPSIEARLSAAELATSFEENRAAILGGMLDLFVKVLGLLPAIKIDQRQRPRMADFAHLGEAVYQAHGRQAGEFLADYAEKRRDGVHRTLDASPVAVACLSWLDLNPQGHDGTVKELFETVTKFKPDGEAWPKSAKGFADSLRRITPSLRLIGINARIGERPGKHGTPCLLKKMGLHDHIHTGGGKVTKEVHHVHQVHPTPPIGEDGELGEGVSGVFRRGECIADNEWVKL